MNKIHYEVLLSSHIFVCSVDGKEGESTVRAHALVGPTTQSPSVRLSSFFSVNEILQ